MIDFLALAGGIFAGLIALALALNRQAAKHDFNLAWYGIGGFIGFGIGLALQAIVG